MSEFIPDTSTFSTLRGKVIVVSGGATGIGAATASLLYHYGAKVFVGDINTKAAEKYIFTLRWSAITSATSAIKGDIFFVPTDVTVYDDIYNLFRTAFDKYGCIDHAVSCAGILEQGSWFDPELTIDSVRDKKESSKVLDVNVLGTAHFARIAVVFLRHGLEELCNNNDFSVDRSLTLLSSVNAFRESPGMYIYQTSKHAIQGLMRSMRKIIYERDGVRVNCVCPGMTESPMTEGIIDKFKEDGLFWQTSEAVATFVAAVQARAGMNGKAIYVEGGDGWEFEDSFYNTQHQWLGTEATRRMRTNAEAVNNVL